MNTSNLMTAHEIINIEETTVEETDDEEIEQEKHLSLTLTPWQKNLSEEEFDIVNSIIKDRLEYLSATCTNSYSDYVINVSIPHDNLTSGVVAESDIVNVLGFIANASSDRMFIHVDNEHYIQLSNEDVKKCEVNEYWPDGKALVIYFSSEKYQYIVELLNYANQESVSPKIQFLYSNYFISESEYSKGLAFDDICIYNEKENAIAIVNDNMFNNRMHEIIGMAMTQNKLPSSFQYQIDYKSITSWQTVNSSPNVGENQVDNVEGITVDVVLKVQAGSLYSDETWLMFNEKIKKRLDSLGVPYQYGYRDLFDDGIVFRLPIRYVGEDVISLLTTSYISKTLTVRGKSDRYMIENIDFLKAEDGSYFMVVSLPMQDFVDRSANYKEELADIEDAMFLSIDKTPISSTSIDNINDNRLIFDNLYFCGEEKISKDYDFLISLFEYLCNEEVDAPISQSIYLSLEATQINKPESDKFEYSFGVKNETRWDRYLQKNVNKFPEITEIKHLKGFSESVIINIKMSDNIQGMEFVETVERIYRELELDKTCYGRISFDHDTTDINKQCSIKFDQSRLTVGYSIYLALLFCDDDASDELSSYLKESEFWSSKFDEEGKLYINNITIE